ncbi:MAG: type II toxin-antitoxin system VapC family toxin [Proteobacteria bacterium]|nr:type II toxin-antitoxin system VapC family toxin [Pseudomonadota bacterium]
MTYLIDTSIAIHAYEGSANVLARMAEHQSALVISALCLIELRRGLYRHPAHFAQARARLDMLLAGIPVLNFDVAAVDAYEGIIARLGFSRGRDYDRLIAAHALSTGSTLVTANTAEFSDIRGLTLENWTFS